MASIQANLQQSQGQINELPSNQRITNIRLQKQLQFLRQSKLQYRVDKIEDYISSQSSSAQSNNDSWSLPIVGNLRLNNQSESGQQMSYRIVIQQGQLPIDNQLVLYIPKAYPFHQPLYYYADSPPVNQSKLPPQPTQPKQQEQLQTLLIPSNKPIPPHQPNLPQKFNLHHQLSHAQPIQQLMIWLPKYKILQLVELIAIKINQKHAQQNVINSYFIGQLLAKILNSPLVVFVMAVLVRVLVSLGSYSGKGDWPNLGDFQAHRNWMSITVNRPLEEWYQQLGDNIWWRIDYPPIAAYLSYVLGSVYKYIQPQAMTLQRGYQSPILFTFMRLSVLLVEACIVFPAVYLLFHHQATSQYTITKKYSLLFLLSFLLKPDLISIDHGHFQYNSLIVGLILGAFYCLLNRSYYTCCVLFTIAIHSKQMAVYYALAFFAGLIGRVMADCRGNKVKIIGEIMKFGVIVIGVSLVIWLPFIVTGSAHYVLEAIFPVHRGLYQLKVQNFWCITDVIMKWQSKFSKQFLMLLCFTISTLLSLPSMLTMILNCTKKTLIIGFFTIAMTFFMFSYHVHEKSILLPLAFAPLLIPYLGPRFVTNLVISGMLGMYHLLKEDGQSLQYFVLLGVNIVFNESFNSMTCELKKFVLQTEKNKTFSEKLHDKIFGTDQTSLMFNFVRYTLYSIPLILHLAQLFISPPQKLQYLHHLLFAFYSFCFNAYSLLLCNGILLQYLLQKITGKKSQEKEN